LQRRAVVIKRAARAIREFPELNCNWHHSVSDRCKVILQWHLYHSGNYSTTILL